MQETQEMQVWSLSREDPLEKEMATHSSVLAWEMRWTEEPLFFLKWKAKFIQGICLQQSFRKRTSLTVTWLFPLFLSATFRTSEDRLATLSSSHWSLEPPLVFFHLLFFGCPLVLLKSHLLTAQFHLPAQLSYFWASSFAWHMFSTQSQETVWKISNRRERERESWNPRPTVPTITCHS